MKAIVQHEYGSPDTLRLEDVGLPDASPGHVLVRVRAASVNAADWHVMRGDPKLARLQLGLRHPKAPVRGRDFAGEVAKVGAGVTHVGPGDEVFGETGTADGAFAGTLCVVRPRSSLMTLGARPPSQVLDGCDMDGHRTSAGTTQQVGLSGGRKSRVASRTLLG